MESRLSYTEPATSIDGAHGGAQGRTPARVPHGRRQRLIYASDTTETPAPSIALATPAA